MKKILLLLVPVFLLSSCQTAKPRTVEYNGKTYTFNATSDKAAMARAELIYAQEQQELSRKQEALKQSEDEKEAAEKYSFNLEKVRAGIEDINKAGEYIKNPLLYNKNNAGKTFTVKGVIVDIYEIERENNKQYAITTLSKTASTKILNSLIFSTSEIPLSKEIGDMIVIDCKLLKASHDTQVSFIYYCD